MSNEPSKKGVLLVVGDIPWHFTKLCHELGAALRREGLEPHFLVSSRYHERMADVDLTRVGKVHKLADALASGDPTDATSAQALDRWLLHTTFTRTRALYGRHTNRWSDYRKLASFITALFDNEPGLGAVWSEPPSGE